MLSIASRCRYRFQGRLKGRRSISYPGHFRCSKWRPHIDSLRDHSLKINVYLNYIGMSKVTLPPRLFKVLFDEHFTQLNELAWSVTQPEIVMFPVLSVS